MKKQHQEKWWAHAFKSNDSPDVRAAALRRSPTLAAAEPTDQDRRVFAEVHRAAKEGRLGQATGVTQTGPRGGKFIIGKNGKKYYPVKGSK